MNTPNLYTPEQVEQIEIQARIGGGLYTARPVGWQGLCLRKRIYFAWKVFTGQWDALHFYGQTGPVTICRVDGSKRKSEDIFNDPYFTAKKVVDFKHKKDK